MKREMRMLDDYTYRKLLAGLRGRKRLIMEAAIKTAEETATKQLEQATSLYNELAPKISPLVMNYKAAVEAAHRNFYEDVKKIHPKLAEIPTQLEPVYFNQSHGIIRILMGEPDYAGQGGTYMKLRDLSRSLKGSGPAPAKQDLTAEEKAIVAKALSTEQAKS
jgi:hypothetical protein